MDDPYVILGVTRTASDEVIEQAYRRLAKVTHPDHVDVSDPAAVAAATEAFKRLEEAHRLLLDHDRRLDWHLRHDRDTEHAPPGSASRGRDPIPTPVFRLDRTHVAGVPISILPKPIRLSRNMLTRVGENAHGLWVQLRPFEVPPAGLLSDTEVYDVQGFEATLTPGRVAELVANPSLRRLDLGRTTIADPVIEALVDLPRLETLKVDGTAVTDAACRSIARMPALQELSVQDTAVTDQGLAWLAGCRHLRALDLRGTKVTSAGLGQLDGLDLWRISVPFRLHLGGLRRLRSAHPNLLIT